MHPRRSRIVVLAGVALTIILAGCNNTPDKNLGPRQTVSQAIANHIDSIYTALQNDNNGVDSALADSVAYAETTPSMGGTQEPVTVTTASGTQSWLGYTFEVALTGTGGDSEFVTAIYSDTAFSNLVVAETYYNNDGTITGTAFIVQDTTGTGFASTTYTGSASVALTAHANNCSVISGINAYNQITTYISSIGADTIGTTACQTANFTISFSAAFPGNANLGALSSVAISNVNFAGVRNFAAVSSPSRIAAKLAARLKLNQIH